MTVMGSRLRGAAKAALQHLVASLAIALLAGALVFGLWFPAPYHVLAGGLTLFGLVVAVDVVCGPLLTLVAFDLKKSKKTLFRDLLIIASLQIVALVYGVYSVAQARPVFLAHEGNRFRLVSWADVDPKAWDSAKPEFQPGLLQRPRQIGVKLVGSAATDFKSSVMLSMQGLHPAFRPERWVGFEELLPELNAELQSLKKVRDKYPEAKTQLEHVLSTHDLTLESAGYLPLDAPKAEPLNWIVIVERKTGLVKDFLPLDGW